MKHFTSAVSEKKPMLRFLLSQEICDISSFNTLATGYLYTTADHSLWPGYLETSNSWLYKTQSLFFFIFMDFHHININRLTTIFMQLGKFSLLFETSNKFLCIFFRVFHCSVKIWVNMSKKRNLKSKRNVDSAWPGWTRC